MPDADRGSPWPWRIVAIALGGLLVAVIVGSLVALALTLSVSQVAERALTQDVAFEDEAEDVHVAVLDLEHQLSTLALVGPTRAGLEKHAASVRGLREELSELAELGIVPPGTVSSGELVAMVDAYVAELDAALSGPATAAGALDAAFDAGLVRLGELERVTASLDAVGTTRAADALRQLGQTTSVAATLLVGVLVAVSIVGLVLTVVATRVLRELRRLSAAERRSAEGLAELLRTRTEFIADASHELRTPLTVLRGNAELGARLPPDDCGHVPVLREIAAESVRMGRLVEELLLLARHDAGDAMVQPRTVELEALAADIAARSERLCRQRGVTLDADLVTTGTAWVDADRIEQAALILVDNASTHSPPGAPVSLGVRVTGGQLVIEVADRGPGIAPEILPHIFERFRRAERSRRGQEGAGLGLAIARAIAEEHGGSIVPAAREGGGTRMTLRIPLVTTPTASP